MPASDTYHQPFIFIFLNIGIGGNWQIENIGYQQMIELVGRGRTNISNRNGRYATASSQLLYFLCVE